MKASNRKITLPTICWATLKECLTQPGWATTPKMIVIAGTLDATDKIAVPTMPKVMTPEQEKAWADPEITVELMAKEIEVIAAAIQYHLSKGAFRANKYSKRMIEEFVEV